VGVIEQRQQQPANDFISHLVTAQVDGDMLSAIEVLSVAVITHFGGSETPSHLISSALIALSQHPEQRALLQQDPTLADAVIEETLRYWSPVNLVFQTAAQDIELYDLSIPQGSYVLSYIGSGNRDERQFQDPDRFDLTRDARSHLSFAHGAHYCPGASLGKRMGAIALNAVLERMPQIRLKDPAIDWLPSLWIRGARTLPVSY
jgi:cytochrome P450